MRRRRRRAVARPVEGIERAEQEAKDIDGAIEGLSDAFLALMRAYEHAGSQLIQTGGDDANVTLSTFVTLVGDALDNAAERQAVQAGAMSNARAYRLQHILSTCVAEKAQIEISLRTQSELENDNSVVKSTEDGAGADGDGQAAGMSAPETNGSMLA